MLIRPLARNVRRLSTCVSGSAAVLLALGAPILIGGAGLGVDLSQWYLWKRELQFAVDQGAIAAAWAKAQDENGQSYTQRAAQAYNANLSLTRPMATAPTISLENYDGGTANSIKVAASATGLLPFSSFLLGGGSTTVKVSAQSIYEPAAAYKPCLIALHPTAGKAMWFHGGPNVAARCGIGALSNASNAIEFTGSPGIYDIGLAVTAGGIDDIHGHTNNATVVQGASNLTDPFAGLTPPNNPTPRTYSCSSSQYSGNRTDTITTSYGYYTGPNPNSLTPYQNYPNPRSGSGSSSTIVGLSFASPPSNSTNTVTTAVQVSGKGNNKVWEVQTTVTVSVYANVVQTQSAGLQSPGTYTSMNVSCNTTLAPGVYVIDGGSLTVEAQYEFSGTGVMFVLKNGAGIRIAGGASANLTAMTRPQLLAAGVSNNDADRMLGMLVFEDPASQGNSQNRLVGNSTSTFNGIFYLPKSNFVVLGTSKGSSQCLTIAAKTIEVGGTADLSTLCPAGATPLHMVASQDTEVRLIK